MQSRHDHQDHRARPEGTPQGMRINRVFTEYGQMSRREADRLIEAGRVRINGRVAKPGDRVQTGDKVFCNGKQLRTGYKKPVVIAYHKPIGVECTSDPNVRGNIIDAVNYSERVFHIGRLDKMSEGLILLTNLGDIVNKILDARFHHEKEYVVHTEQPITDSDISKLRSGIVLAEGKTRPCTITRINGHSIKVILTEGKNRQIRRMLEDVGLKVTRLKRMRVMNIELGHLPRGKWRSLSPSEYKYLMDQLKKTDAK